MKTNEALTTGLTARLSLMMFLEWFIAGAWYVTVGNYMTKIGMSSHIFWAYTVIPISALISPYFLGLAADRYFASEKILGVLHLIGGVAMFCAPWAAEPPGLGAGQPHGSVVFFIGLLLLHALCFAPTMALTGSLAFHHLTRPERQFPLIRVFGTIGWIIAGCVVSMIFHADKDALSLRIAGLGALVLGLYSFTLPHTPPAKAGQTVALGKIVDFEALRALGSRPFWIFMACAFLIFIPMSAYYSYAPVFVDHMKIQSPAFKMAFGQMSEILFMLAIPLFFARLGVKWMIGVGMAMWAVRYGLFAGAASSGSLAMIMAAIIVHGICYDFMFVVGQIYVDKKATASNRAQAQGLYVLVTNGLGQGIGSLATGWLFNCLVEKCQHTPASWQTYWAIPAIFAGVVAVVFLFGFRDPEAEKKRAER